MRQRTKRSPLTRTRYTASMPSYILHSLQLQPSPNTGSYFSNHIQPLLSSINIHNIWVFTYLKAIGWIYRCEKRQSRWGKDGINCSHHCLPVLLLWEHFPALSSCSKHYVAQPSAGLILTCQWPCKADNHHCAGERWAPTLPLQPINPAQTRVYPDS